MLPQLRETPASWMLAEKEGASDTNVSQSRALHKTHPTGETVPEGRITTHSLGVHLRFQKIKDQTNKGKHNEELVR